MARISARSHLLSGCIGLRRVRFGQLFTLRKINYHRSVYCLLHENCGRQKKQCAGVLGRPFLEPSSACKRTRSTCHGRTYHVSLYNLVKYVAMDGEVRLSIFFNHGGKHSERTLASKASRSFGRFSSMHFRPGSPRGK